MRVLSLLPQAFLLLSAAQSGWAASSWSFTDGSVSVQGKGAGVGGGVKEKYEASLSWLSSHRAQTTNDIGRLTPSKPLLSSSPVKLGAGETLKVILTTQEGKSAKRPHQAFLLLQDPSTNLDISYPFNVKDSGKAKVELVR